MNNIKYKFMSIISIVIIISALIFISMNKSTDITGNIIVDDVEDVKELNEISVRLPIPFQDAAFVPFYVADKLGYYEDEGLKVNFNLGNSETNPAKMVAIGADDIGVLGGPDAMLVAKSKGQDLVAVSILHKDSDFVGILSLKNSNIETLDDLNGKKIGFFYGHISTDILHSLFNKYDIDYEEIDVGASYNQLIADQIDAQWTFRTTGIVNLEDKGYELNYISPKEYGINTHGYTIFAKEDTIEDESMMIEAFLRATFKGVEYSIDNPETAVGYLIEIDSNLDYDLELKRWDMYADTIINADTYPKIGYFSEEMLVETYDRLDALNVIENQFDIKESYTTKFIEKIYS